MTAEAILPPSMTTVASMSPWRDVPHPVYAPSFHFAASIDGGGTGGVTIAEAAAGSGVGRADWAAAAGTGAASTGLEAALVRAVCFPGSVPTLAFLRAAVGFVSGAVSMRPLEIDEGCTGGASGAVWP